MILLLNKRTTLLESKKKPFLENVFIILLALCPILQHYKGLYINAAITVLLVSTPYAIVRILAKRKLFLTDISFVSPLLMYFLYRVIDHGTSISETGQFVILCFLLIAISSDCFNTSFFIRVITSISILASICITIQYIGYYFFGIHIQMVPISLLLPRSNQWVLLAQTGRSSITGRISSFYRPSAFFLEPSHMFIFMFTPLIINLLSSKSSNREIIFAFIISFGIVLSTSGMGIITTLGVWFVYIIRSNKNQEGLLFFHPLKAKSILFLLLLVAFFLFSYYQVPFFHSSIKRLIGSENGYSNAITGRTQLGLSLIRQLKDFELIVGVEDKLTGIEFNMSGFNSIMYRYGIIGIIISYYFYLKGFFLLKGVYYWITIVIIFLSFFSSHTHSTMFMIYMSFVFVDRFKEIRFKESNLTKNNN